MIFLCMDVKPILRIMHGIMSVLVMFGSGVMSVFVMLGSGVTIGSEKNEYVKTEPCDEGLRDKDLTNYF